MSDVQKPAVSILNSVDTIQNEQKTSMNELKRPLNTFSNFNMESVHKLSPFLSKPPVICSLPFIKHAVNVGLLRKEY